MQEPTRRSSSPVRDDRDAVGTSAATVVTVRGEIDPGVLGPCQVHEHLLITGGLITVREPAYTLDSEERAAEELDLLKGVGCKAVVEMTPLGCGRDPRGLARISEVSGVHVIACTGFHKSDFYSDIHWMHSYPADVIARLLVRELADGMDQHGLNGPHPDWTDVRAGVIKLATDYHHATATQQKLFEAGAQAHLETGAPIATHTEHGTFGVQQAEMLIDLGVPAASIAIGHIDHDLDLGHLREVAQLGCYLQFDRQHRYEQGPDSDLRGAIQELCGLGHEGQLLFGMDIAKREKFKAHGGGPGLVYLIEDFLPRLTGSELPAPIEQFLVRNPRRFLAWQR